MNAATVELMHDQVRAIYRALTGNDLPESTQPAHGPQGNLTAEEVTERFSSLEGVARTMAAVAERVPPFSFAPPVDVLDEERELLVEVAVPGIDQKDVDVELKGDQLVISGVRAGERAGNGRRYRHAEIPRGPFRRVILLPYQVGSQPRIEVEKGLIRIHLSKSPKAPAAQA